MNTTGPVSFQLVSRSAPDHRGDRAQVGPLEERDELRGEEDQHQIEPHRAHRLGHAVDDVAVALERARHPAVDDARDDEEDEDQGHDAAQHRPQVLHQSLVLAAGSRNQPFSGNHEEEQTDHHHQHGEAGQLEPALLHRAERAHSLGGVFDALLGAARVVGPSLGSTMRVVTSVPTIVIRNVLTIMKNQLAVGRISFASPGAIGRVDEARRLGGDAGEQRIDRADQQVGGVAAGDTGKGRRQTDQWIATDRVENHGRERE